MVDKDNQKRKAEKGKTFDTEFEEDAEGNLPVVAASSDTNDAEKSELRKDTEEKGKHESSKRDPAKDTAKKGDNQWIYFTGKEIYNFFSRVKNKISGVTVYALVGKSGTGKSFRARLLAEKLGVSFIIDDGLLIYGDIIVAGRSAKQAAGYLNAIKTALFTEDAHRDMVMAAIKEHKVKKLLLLGTSTKMVHRVADRLDLPPITQIITIEEIASKEDIEAAIKSREEGKHVIPVPAIEIKRDYSRILADTIKIFFFWDKKKEEGKQSKFFEKSIVRPDFAGQQRRSGKVTITEAALSQMIFHCIDEFDSSVRVKKLKIKVLSSGFSVEIDLIVPFGMNINSDLEELRNYICSMIQRYTGIGIEHLELSVAEIVSPKEEEEA
ncbi:ATP-binding protein [Desulforhopalus vacuolatus]|uniref:ATP-binding protein n=1 Tax=Desulforhopalus vacuolatus TaxID=40414 RepID=UPI001F05DCF2|nr:ATP-binding protein [Desulforhopalus vacuolatus]